MKCVYVAGPYRARDAWSIEQNIRAAEAVSLDFWRNGVAAICPHSIGRFFQGAVTDDAALAVGHELVRRCDAVVLVGDWRRSIGTRAEITVAEESGLPVFDDIQTAVDWSAGRYMEAERHGVCEKCNKQVVFCVSLAGTILALEKSADGTGGEFVIRDGAGFATRKPKPNEQRYLGHSCKQ